MDRRAARPPSPGAVVARPRVVDNRRNLAAALDTYQAVRESLLASATAMAAAGASTALLQGQGHVGPTEAVDDSGVNWDSVVSKVLDRGEKECAICMCALDARPRQAWLSCTHVFHADCLLSMELFEAARGVTALRCPMCRLGYCKRVTDAADSRLRAGAVRHAAGELSVHLDMHHAVHLLCAH